MKKIKSFLQSIYLGDRYCEKVEIRDQKILFQLNCISRLEEGTKEWNYYTEKDIEHGYLVFDEVVNYCAKSKLSFNDEIYEIEVIDKKDKIYSFMVYGCNMSADSISTDIEMLIKAKKFYIFDPKDGSIITE